MMALILLDIRVSFMPLCNHCNHFLKDRASLQCHKNVINEREHFKPFIHQRGFVLKSPEVDRGPEAYIILYRIEITKILEKGGK